MPDEVAALLREIRDQQCLQLERQADALAMQCSQYQCRGITCDICPTDE